MFVCCGRNIFGGSSNGQVCRSLECGFDLVNTLVVALCDEAFLKGVLSVTTLQHRDIMNVQ